MTIFQDPPPGSRRALRLGLPQQNESADHGAALTAVAPALAAPEVAIAPEPLLAPHSHESNQPLLAPFAAERHDTTAASVPATAPSEHHVSPPPALSRRELREREAQADRAGVSPAAIFDAAVYQSVPATPPQSGAPRDGAPPLSASSPVLPVPSNSTTATPLPAPFSGAAAVEFAAAPEADRFSTSAPYSPSQSGTEIQQESVRDLAEPRSVSEIDPEAPLRPRTPWSLFAAPEEPVDAEPVRPLAPTGHWTQQAQIDDETQSAEPTLSRAVGEHSAVTTNALVLPTVPQVSDIISPITATGEILVTGSISLPSSLGETGAHPLRIDNSDYENDPMDREVLSSDSVPVRAIRAVSTYTSTHGVIAARRPQGNRTITALIVSATVMSVGVVGLLVTGIALNFF